MYMYIGFFNLQDKSQNLAEYLKEVFRIIVGLRDTSCVKAKLG